MSFLPSNKINLESMAVVFSKIKNHMVKMIVLVQKLTNRWKSKSLQRRFKHLDSTFSIVNCRLLEYNCIALGDSLQLKTL